MIYINLYLFAYLFPLSLFYSHRVEVVEVLIVVVVATDVITVRRRRCVLFGKLC